MQTFSLERTLRTRPRLSQNLSSSTGIVLRVPLLYGETEYNTEGPVNFLLDVVMDHSGKTYNS
jgi:hypothetical protein